jgi:hypothetical protein
MLLAKTLFLFGCLPFLFLGTLHIAYTLFDIRAPRKLVPYKSEVINAMKSSTLALTKETDMWRAWVGFNISHGVGVLAFSSIYAYLAYFHSDLLFSSTFLLVGAPAIAGIYLLLSKRYWFSIPALGSLIGLIFFISGITANAL